MRYLMLLLFFMSNLGWCLFLHRKFKLQIMFTPIITITISFVILFICGMLNLLLPSVYILFIIGIVLLIINWRQLLDKKITIYMFAFYLVLILLLVLRLRGEYLYAWDDFVQWASSVKAMLINDRLPDIRDLTFVCAPHYAYGNSLWIYYVSRIVSNQESMMMLAQNMISIGCIFAISSYIKEKSIFKWVIFTLLSVYFLSVNIHVTSLYVDTIMPLLGLAGISIIMNQKENPEPFMALIIVMLSQTKTNSIFFVVIILVTYLLYSKHNLKTRIIKTILFGLIPLITITRIWDLNYYLRFSSNAVTTNVVASSATENTVSTMFGGKTLSDILDIALNVIKNYLNISFNRKVNLWILITTIIISIIASNNKKEIIKNVLEILLIYIAYVFSSIYAYLTMFSFERYKIYGLESFDRYAICMIMFIVGIATIKLLKKDRLDKKTYILASICIAIITINNYDTKSLFIKETQNCGRRKFKDMLSTYDIKPLSSYIIVDVDYLSNNGHKGDDYTINCYQINYDLWHNGMTVIQENSEIEDALFDWHKNYDYLIIDTPTNETNAYLDKINREDLKDQEYVILYKEDVMK